MRIELGLYNSFGGKLVKCLGFHPYSSCYSKLEVVKDKIKSPKSKDESESLKFTQKNLINKIYTNSADAKIPAVLEYLGTVIEVLLPSAASKQENVNKELVTAPAGCKFFIFAHHQPMIDAIHECLLKKKVGCIRIDGGTPGA
ncbi:uncharacterized protein [Arachis hypogaea]|uniref:uncharacterized protein isoform X5 n=1 Tax=Arachis hypogaea TaxID=3818 RepID=UPI003B21C1DF